MMSLPRDNDAYGCVEPVERHAVLSPQHTRFRWVPLGELETLTMPQGCKTSIRRFSGASLQGRDPGRQ